MKSLDAGILSNCAGRDKKPRATATAASGDMTNRYSGSPVRNTAWSGHVCDHVVLTMLKALSISSYKSPL